MDDVEARTPEQGLGPQELRLGLSAEANDDVSAD
jgi:hypothetical protein